MSFGDFVKNPSKYIWDVIDKKKGKITTNTSEIPTNNITSTASTDLKTSSKNLVEILIKDYKGFLVAVESKDWKWLLRGKTGLFLKIAVPAVFLLIVISAFLSPKSSSTNIDDKPSVIDQGDTLEKPKFKSSNYLNGSFSDNKFLVYSHTANKINEFGLRGILLSNVETKPEITFYYPLNKVNYLFYSENKLQLRYMVEVEIPDSYPKKTQTEERFMTVLDNLDDIRKIKELHITYDNNFAFVLDNVFYVYSITGDKLKEYPIKDNISSPTYLNGEIYYVREVKPFDSIASESSSTMVITPDESKPTYHLIKLNKNDEEVYSQNLGDLKVQRISIVNSDRFLILIEKPSETSFYNIQMRDSGKRTIFNVTPIEKEVKITNSNNLYFSSEDNVIFIQGNGVAKLFNLNGEQLWIN